MNSPMDRIIQGALMLAMVMACILAALVLWKKLTGAPDQDCPEPAENVAIAWGFLIAAGLAGLASLSWVACNEMVSSARADAAEASKAY